MIPRNENITLAREYLMHHSSATTSQVRQYFADNGTHVSKQSVNSSLNQLVERGEATKHFTGTYAYNKKQYSYHATALIGTLPKHFRKIPREIVALENPTPEGVLMLQSILATMRGRPTLTPTP